MIVPIHFAAAQNLIVSLSFDNVHPAVSQLLFLIVFSKFHHATTQDPNVYCPKQLPPCGNS